VACRQNVKIKHNPAIGRETGLDKLIYVSGSEVFMLLTT